MIIAYEGIKPKISLNVFIASTVTMIGDMEIKDNASIWL
jgi:carbonic anhydrase/acetyltransferase-like protein (isoleucine patch superfamily)